MEINGKNYELTYGLRPMFVFEEMAGKPFEVNTLLDTYIFCYACIISNKDNPPLDFSEFIDHSDSHPEVMVEFNEFVSSEVKKRDFGDKKKVTRKGRNAQ
jgi:hypothetical protein